MKQVGILVVSSLSFFGCNSGQPAPSCTTAEACMKNGRELRQKKSGGQAEKHFLAACDHGDLEGCFQAGRTFDDTGGVDTDLPRARKHYQRACEKKHARSCAWLGDTYRGSLDGELVLDKYLKYLDMGCRLGAPSACGSLAFDYEYGEKGLSIDAVKAASYEVLACKYDPSMCD